ncbi:TPA: hypothetical protein ACP43H_004973, partial [Escherichia coli]
PSKNLINSENARGRRPVTARIAGKDPQNDNGYHFNVVRFLPPSHRTGDYEGTTPRSVNAVNPGVYRF